ILFERRLYQRAQSGEAAAHVGHTGRDPDARVRRKCDHPRKHSSTTRSTPASTWPMMRTCAFASVRLIEPGRAAASRSAPHGVLTAAGAGSLFSPSSATVTG